jgi:predicted nicotinamide N-methyase
MNTFDQLEACLQQTISSASLAPRSLPLCPDVSLYVLTDDFPRGPLPHDEMLKVLNEPAYWAFCWASGQVLAQHLIENRDLFQAKSVLDFGAGSGVVGIAAALAGAKRVICCDIDPAALLACKANAELNQVTIELLDDIDKLDGEVDWLIAADVLYDRANFPWISKLPERARQVLIADSRVKKDKLEGYAVVGRTEATTIPDLDEFKEFNDVRIYQTKAGA